MLNSFVSLENLQCVTVTGHNNPTVNCSHGGGLHLINCRNCTIEGITWVGCGGAANKHRQPAILVHNSCNITIQNCSFLHSQGHAVALSKVWGDVSFNHCEFLENTDYGGHGVAIHYSSNAAVKMLINYCTFNDNGKKSSKSIIYIAGNSSLHNIIILKDSSFNKNIGNPIYVTMQNVRVDGQVMLTRNKANNGGGIFAINSNITFGKMSRVTFEANKATDKTGGAISLSDHSSLQLKQASKVTFTNNNAKNGGAVHIDNMSSILFLEHSTVNFTENRADANGGAIGCEHHSIIIFKNTSMVSFIENIARLGGAIFSDDGSTVSFEGNSKVDFIGNNGTERGGAVVIHKYSAIIFKGNSQVTFTSHDSINGGAIRSSGHCKIMFTENSEVMFTSNAGYSGGAVDAYNHGNLIFEGNTRVVFANNEATNGGSLFLHTKSNTIFKDNSYIEFVSNTARGSGGAVYTYENSDITVIGSPNIHFTHNVAKSGGAVHVTICNIQVSGTSNISFNNNEAVHEGGAVYLSDDSSMLFDRNVNMNLAHNSADLGAGMYNDLSKNTIITFNNKQLHHYNNTARVAGSLMYVYVPLSCDNECLEERIVIFNEDTSAFVATSPKRIVLYDPAIPQCNDSNSTTKECNTYYVKNVMLGQEILINSCLIDYYDKPTEEAVQLLVTSDNMNYTHGSKYVLLSCNLPLRINITGSKTLLMDYTVTLRTFNLDRVTINVNVTVMITPCHPGFSYHKNLQKCECYNANDIVFCSGSSSTIKRGYWFGSVSGQPTVTFCPINYCNFTCCETSNRYYHLSPVRDNQCRSHRSGAACGSCTDGFTLSYDSTECVSVESCTVGQTVLVIMLSIIYWIVMVILVFAMMYYKVGIGYLYGITYYYSIVDILLTQNLYTSREIYLTVNIMSSFYKIIPQFLGELCLTTGTSGIDQQFIHYIHPSAIIVILGIISLSARISQRISVIISRGIIHVICLLLLLSYTSIASTSLLLMRPLKFHEIDKVYTFLSPDIEYFKVVI